MVAWLFALPFVLVFGVFMLMPLVSSFAMSFTDFKSSDVQDPFAVNFVGIDQYVDLFGNTQFVKSMVNTGLVVFFGIPLTMAAGLALALALNSGITRLRTAFRVGFYMPVVTSIVAVAVVWRFILQPEGLLNTILGWVGISGPDWLNNTATALPALIVMTAWRNVGTLMVIFLAGLQAVPRNSTRPQWSTALLPGSGSAGSPCRSFARRCCWARCCCQWGTCSSSRKRSS